jgi:hypothetical protein
VPVNVPVVVPVVKKRLAFKPPESGSAKLETISVEPLGDRLYRILKDAVNPAGAAPATSFV